MPLKLDGLSWLLIIVVTVLGVITLVRRLSGALSSFIDDGCPEAGCDGHLRFTGDSRFNNEPVAVWTCTQCDYEVLRRANGPDVVRSTDPAMTP